jgi:hypothetical protein
MNLLIETDEAAHFKGFQQKKKLFMDIMET